VHVHGKYSYTHEVFIVDQLSQNLLGLQAIKDLHLLAIVNLQTDYAESIQQQFLHLFTGLGTLQVSMRFVLNLKFSILFRNSQKHSATNLQ